MKWQRRDKKRLKKRRQLRLHGASLKRIVELIRNRKELDHKNESN